MGGWGYYIGSGGGRGWNLGAEKNLAGSGGILVIFGAPSAPKKRRDWMDWAGVLWMSSINSQNQYLTAFLNILALAGAAHHILARKKFRRRPPLSSLTDAAQPLVTHLSSPVRRPSLSGGADDRVAVVVVDSAPAGVVTGLRCGRAHRQCPPNPRPSFGQWGGNSERARRGEPVDGKGGGAIPLSTSFLAHPRRCSSSSCPCRLPPFATHSHTYDGPYRVTQHVGGFNSLVVAIDGVSTAPALAVVDSAVASAVACLRRGGNRCGGGERRWVAGKSGGRWWGRVVRGGDGRMLKVVVRGQQRNQPSVVDFTKSGKI
ncbi:hypothetical protein CPC08DRAFT_731255 [Agrocybe pediades]|nr:hypothetical protein CPC08DRAFT_731255 [Agrocybe pediades]